MLGLTVLITGVFKNVYFIKFLSMAFVEKHNKINYACD